MAIQPTLDEQSFNTGLAQAIRQRKAMWGRADIVQDERRRVFSGSTARPDIFINDPLSPPVIIEVSYDASDAEKDARSRLGRQLNRGGDKITAAVAVCIPHSYRDLHSATEVTAWLLEGSTVEYALIQGLTGVSGTRWPTRGLISGGLDELIAILPAVCQSSAAVARLADDVAQQVKWCAGRFKAHTPSHSQAAIANCVRQRMPWHGLTTASVLWLNALLSQGRLSKMPNVGVPTLEKCKDQFGCPIPSEVEAAWRAALAVNFRSIFAPALTSLCEATGTSAMGVAKGLACLFKAAERIERARLGSYIDIGAELFPRLSEDRKTSAAFYTRPTAAELLASLSIREGEDGQHSPDWGDPCLGRKLRIADTACGTGTLVRAGYRQIRNFHEKHGGNAADIHSDFMEHGVLAVDISAIAVQLTATSLSAMEPHVPYGDVQIGCVPVGGSVGRTGSLEFLECQEVGDLFQHSFEASRGRDLKDKDEVMSASLPPLSLDYFLANPPYSRTRGGQSLFDVAGLSDTERRASQRRARHLGRQTCANLKAGLATFFLAKADKKLRVGGTMGFVLPLTAASALSYKATRKLIETRYRDVIALTVAGGATGEKSLSSDTGMSEMLLVATKADAAQSVPSPVICVNLDDGLTEIGHARETARAVLQAVRRHPRGEHGEIRVGAQRLGTWVRRTRTGSGDPWSELGTAHSDLAVAAAKLACGELTDLRTKRTRSLPVPMVTLGDLFDIGPTHHRIGHLVGNAAIGAFEFHPIDPKYPVVRDLALWQANAKEQRCLQVEPTHRGVDPPNADSALQASMRAKSGGLFYARNLRWTSQALLVATTERTAMGGSAWTVLRHDDERVCKAFAIWANSTLGLITHWTQAGKQQQGRSRVQVGAIKQIPVPDLPKLASAQLDWAQRAFEQLKDRDLLPACQAHADETRKAIDQAALEILGLFETHTAVATPQQTTQDESALRSINNLRVEFSREPQIHGNNRQALQVLQGCRP